jgi:hypothetical protein
MRWWMFFYFVGSLAFARQVQLGNGITCVDTTSTFLMRDRGSACGESTIFCTTPLSCSSGGQYFGGGVATCRAVPRSSAGIASAGATGVGTSGGLGCPDLQSCVDEPHQEFITENEASRWQRGGGDQPSPRPHPGRRMCGTIAGLPCGPGEECFFTDPPNQTDPAGYCVPKSSNTNRSPSEDEVLVVYHEGHGDEVATLVRRAGYRVKQYYGPGHYLVVETGGDNFSVFQERLERLDTRNHIDYIVPNVEVRAF